MLSLRLRLLDVTASGGVRCNAAVRALPMTIFSLSVRL